jgi:NADH-quinone oxidoreductase subunit H
VTHLLAAAGGDPLLNGDIDLAVVLIVAFKVIVAFAILLLGVMLMIWFERKLIADMQNRVGPNVAGPWGVLQTLADGIKLFFKEDLLPERADLFVFRLAPLLTLVPAFVVFTIVPLGGVFANGNDGIVHIFGHDTYLQVADPPIGILLFLAMSSIAVYGIMLAGWSSGSKYPLIGSVRASAQMVSYEAALGLAVATVVLVSGTLSTHGMVSVQDRLVDWNVVATGVVPFVIFLIAATAEMNRPPFDLVEAEQEIVGGYNTEYASIRFALFYIAEFMNVVTISAIIVTLFFGGPRGPLLFGPDWIWPTVWFFLKVLVFIFTYVWFRATLPRLRYDQLMDLGWKTLIPLAFGWLLIISLLRLARDRDWNVGLAAAIGFAVGALCWALLSAAIAVAKRNRLDAGETF